MISNYFDGQNQSQDLEDIFNANDVEQVTEELEGQLAVDVYQTADSVIVVAPVAGVDPGEIDISITDDVITIRGERKEESKVEKEHYIAQECYWGAFSRSVILPVAVVAEKAQATFKNGILTVKIPKLAKTRAKTIKVKPIK